MFLPLVVGFSFCQLHFLHNVGRISSSVHVTGRQGGVKMARSEIFSRDLNGAWFLLRIRRSDFVAFSEFYPRRL